MIAPTDKTESSPNCSENVEVKPAAWLRIGAYCLVIIFALIAFHNSFSVPFIFGDRALIIDNAQLQYFGKSIDLTKGSFGFSNPLVILTFAVNRAFGGEQVESYHAVNLCILVLASLTLFGVVRRTLTSTRMVVRFGTASLLLATTSAILWCVHPLQTEIVNYISQRTEALLGLFYLLTLYCFIRSTNSPHRTSWLLASLSACLLGALSNPAIATVPFLVLLYDALFVAGRWTEAVKRNWRYYIGLSSVWLVSVILVACGALHAVGKPTDANWLSYGLTLCQSVIQYLRLSIWPDPLILDHGYGLVNHADRLLILLIFFFVLMILTICALWRRLTVGFVGAWYLAILVPVALLIPAWSQPMVESRASLPLAAVVSLFVLGLYSILRRRSLIIFVALAVGLSLLSVRRNESYHSELNIWEDTIAKCPANPRAHLNRGAILEKTHRALEGIDEYEQALRLDPDYAEAHLALGLRLGRNPARQHEAITHYEAAVRLEPKWVEAQVGLGNLLLAQHNRLLDAIVCYRAALRLKPDVPEIHCDLGNALIRIPERRDDAIAEYKAALRLNPQLPEVHCALGVAFAHDAQKWDEAKTELNEALRLKKVYPVAEYNLGVLLSRMPDRASEAVGHFEAALRSVPDYLEAHYNLGLLLAKDKTRSGEAIAHFEAALKIDPSLHQAQRMIERLHAPQIN